MDIYAHRGSTVLAPENTMTAFDQALALGADVLEIDVRLSRDRQVMVIHDASVDRTCNGRGKVKNMTLQQLKCLDAGYHFIDRHGRSARGQNIKLISLEEMLRLLPDARINIDIKDDFYDAASAVAQVVEKSGCHNNINVGSFHAQTIAWFRELAPDISTAASSGEVARLYFGRRYCSSTQFQYLQIPLSYFGLPLATKRFVKHASDRKLKCVYWTVNDLKTMHRLLSLGVSGVVTDRVDLAAKVVGKSACSAAD